MIQAMYEVMCDPVNKKTYYESLWEENQAKNNQLIDSL